MRVAVLADVHGNAPALAAVLAELEREAPDVVVFCGDLTWGSLPRETLALVRSLAIPARFVRGNADRALLELSRDEVERLSPAEIAPVLGLTANGVAALAYRAREGLRQAYLQQHLGAPAEDGCTIVNGKLGAYVRGGLAKRETALVDREVERGGGRVHLALKLIDVVHWMVTRDAAKNCAPRRCDALSTAP